jgi:hypothetical protein
MDPCPLFKDKTTPTYLEGDDDADEEAERGVDGGGQQRAVLLDLLR